MSEENKNAWEYIEPEDLIAKPTFKSSNKAGYVEETVDQWANDVRAKYTDLANNFNEAIHKLTLTQSSLDEATEQNTTLSETNKRLINSKGGPTQEEVDELTENLETAKAQYNELLQNYEAVHARNTELEQTAGQPVSAAPQVVQSFDREVAAEDGYTYVLEYTEAGNVATVREFPDLQAVGKNAEHALSELMDLVDESLMALREEGKSFPQPGEYEKPEESSAAISLDTAKVTAILDAASSEAGEHVRRTQEQMFRLEEAARREAESIVSEAHADAEESRQELARNRSESENIRNRMILLYEAQLSELKNNETSVGYNPAISSADGEDR